VACSPEEESPGVEREAIEALAALSREWVNRLAVGTQIHEVFLRAV
jgi:hypothetical protein